MDAIENVQDSIHCNAIFFIAHNLEEDQMEEHSKRMQIFKFTSSLSTQEARQVAVGVEIYEIYSIKRVGDLLGLLEQRMCFGTAERCNKLILICEILSLDDQVKQQLEKIKNTHFPNLASRSISQLEKQKLKNAMPLALFAVMANEFTQTTARQVAIELGFPPGRVGDIKDSMDFWLLFKASMFS